MADALFNFTNIAKALSDESRLRILMALAERELCVCQVTGLLDLSPSTTSKHLSILRQARLIESRKKGRWVYYRVSESPIPVVKEALAWVGRSLEESSSICEDKERIKEILCHELTLVGDAGAALDNYHSLEIHSLAAKDETEA